MTAESVAPELGRRKAGQRRRNHDANNHHTTTQNHPNPWKHFNRKHRAVARMVVYCLTLMTEHAMFLLAAVLYARLQPRERAILAIAVLWSLTDEEFAAVIECISEGEV